ncbi:fimbrial protein [Salmonella enterica]|uniref:Type 1 fimbrial protein n=3 Tax=Salmonella enterica TaxID=28901 RepID=A0A657G1T3_SALET|nr:fimbrial protein [Salmonella enterica]EAW2245605.1 type 1 fimbrial protein [Salmonella enterica subsp. enterica]EBZ5930161.1 type 1 fimbrial protein [Salmonella enterica subsp. enterica serovar Weslaco]ECS7545777.1 type 1 fimbrial protein [Salmonella enterica subsp. enterica serovar Denver]EDU6324240.1 fimbrial protein [Salmonella enterica subsp. enterica serovar Edinburgh]EEJ6745726.1 fimbrial protein [Salmonella enterica subsp. enterica serovar Oslo]
MNKKLLLLLVLVAIQAIQSARADYFASIVPQTLSYTFKNLVIPENVGQSNGAWKDGGSLLIQIQSSEGRGSYIDLNVAGTLVGDNTYATSNPGIGIKYKTTISSVTDTGGQTETAPNFRFVMGNDATSSDILRTYLHVQYQIVRLLDKIPPGQITYAPEVSATLYNPDGEGDSVITTSVYSTSVSVQPTITACGIDAPAEIKLSPLYGNNVQSGPLNVSPAQTIKLTNCPGAINGIKYNFAAVYGTHLASKGVLNTVTGDGYAEGVYIQVQNADGTAHRVNGAIAVSGYNGSGDYTLPDFKVAYYVDDVNSVRPGNVKSAIEIKLSYN